LPIYCPIARSKVIGMVKSKKKLNKHKTARMDGVDNVVNQLLALHCVRDVKTGAYQRVSTAHGIGEVIRNTKPVNGGVPLIYVGRTRCGQAMTVYPVKGQQDQVYNMLRKQYGI